MNNTRNPSKSSQIMFAIVIGIIFFMAISIYSAHVANKDLCAPLKYEVKNNVLYCWYKDAWHTQKALAKIGRKK